jgi:CspA family cold shock protein
MATGTVKWFNAQKGFGFIQPDDGSKDVFVHITAVQAAGLTDLSDGQKVSYDVVAERGKQAASNLKLAWSRPAGAPAPTYSGCATLSAGREAGEEHLFGKYVMVKRRKEEQIVGVLEFGGRTSEDPDVVAWLAEHKARKGGKIRIGEGGKGVRVAFTKGSDMALWKARYEQALKSKKSTGS